MFIDRKDSENLHIGLLTNMRLSDMIALGSLLLSLISAFILNLVGAADMTIVCVGIIFIELSLLFKNNIILAVCLLCCLFAPPSFPLYVWLYVLVFLAALVRIVLLVGKTFNNAFISMFIIGFALILFSSITIIKFETLEACNIKNLWDGVWWTICTMTTVGYGDKFPITDGGRIMALILMLSGIGLYGSIIGYFSTYFTDKEKNNNNNVDTIEELSKQIADLKQIVEKINTEK